MKKRFYLVSLIVISVFFVACGKGNEEKVNANKKQKELTISVAASLKEPIEEIKKSFEKEKGVKLNINLGGSGALEKQIEQGAEVDVFISASTTNTDKLKEKGFIEEGSYKEFLSNSLVFIVSNSYDKNIKDIKELKEKNIKIALGEISTVPAGQYAKEYLDKEGLWEEFKDNIVYAKDVKAVLNYVEKGELEAGIVYKSDAVLLEKSYIAYEIPESKHRPILYPMAIISKSKNKDLAKEFADYLLSSNCKKIYSKYNFITR